MGWVALAAGLLLVTAAAAGDGGASTAEQVPGDAGISQPEDKGTVWAPLPPAPLPPFDPARGRALYDRHCRSCHGRSGRGNGPVAPGLTIQPRDLTLGTFKFRSTPSGSVPTDADLFVTVTLGLGGAMPGWGGLPAADRWQLVQMVKSFSPRFQREPATRVLTVSPASGGDVDRGRAVYARLACAVCHGEDGRGQALATPAMIDDQRRAVALPNLRRAEVYRAGCSPGALQKTLFTGLDGTPMPAYESALDAGDARDLVAFVRSLLARPEGCSR